MNHEIIYTHDMIDDVVKDIHPLFQHASVFTFSGTLGAGKTTLIQALLRSYGVQGPIKSPTYAYMNQYVNEKGDLFYHFDLYRLSSLESFLEAGFDEYLYEPGAWAFIEWPDIIQPLLTRRVCHFYIQQYGYEQRKLCYQCM
jgi:tRNA threonylcarbamoyladenosine biosynthesis protein TsaE